LAAVTAAAPTTEAGLPGTDLTPRGRIWFAQGLRGIACLMVAWSHMADLFITNQLQGKVAGGKPPWVGFATWLDGLGGVNFGFLGVSIFFLVSGFVIPFSLQRGGPKQFFVRRVFRLYPTLWACTVVSLAVLTIYFHGQGASLPYGKRDIFGSLTLTSQYTGNRFVVGPYWTLAVEELFYLVAAIMAWRKLLHRPVALLGAGALLATVAIVVGHGIGITTTNHFWLRYHVSRYSALVIFILVGVVLHHMYRRTWRPSTGVPMIAALLGLLTLAINQGSVTSGVGWVENALLALAIFVPLLALHDKLPFSRSLDWIADISYPLYLLHGSVGVVTMIQVYDGTESIYLALAVGFVAAIASSAAVHYLVERPSMTLGRRLGRRLDEDPPAVAEPVGVGFRP
jgi:peptidoglycan/LPS O-acetylase OafA/YrhL